MNILVTLDSNYINPLTVMLKSLADTNKEESITLYVAHSSLTCLDLKKLDRVTANTNICVVPIKIDDRFFADAPRLKRVSKETYYRIFAPLYLPESVDRILYLDPDTILLNSLNAFYHTDFGDSLIIGAKHFDGPIDVWNRGRLGITHSKKYINAGIMLLDIRGMRSSFNMHHIFSMIKRYHSILFLADQDLINILYDGRIKTFTEFKINMDERTFRHILKKCSLEEGLEFVKDNTLIVHYNGKEKPWNETYNGCLKGFWDKYANSNFVMEMAYDAGA